MKAIFTKGQREDWILIDRQGFSQARLTFPKKGVIPHDAVHLIVEQALGISSAFWGRIADGADPADLAGLASLGGHASSKRAEVPLDEIIELVQAERAVECFEAEMWSEPSEPSTFLGVLEAACRQSKVSSPEVTVAQIESVRRQLRDFHQAWKSLPLGGSASLDWGGSAPLVGQ